MPKITTRRWKSWGRDAAERAVKTFAQGVLASGLIIPGDTVDVMFTLRPWSIGLAAAGISVLTSLASKELGPSPARASVVLG